MSDRAQARALLELERAFWERAGDATFYRERLAEGALMVFPAPYGLLDRQATIAAVGSSTGWQDVDFQETCVVELGEGAAALAYRVRASRPGEPPYETYASSVYVRRGGEWMLALHQQTPLGAAA